MILPTPILSLINLHLKKKGRAVDSIHCHDFLTNAFCRLLESNASAMVSGVRGVSGLASTNVAGFMMLPSFSRSSTSNTRLALGGTMGVMPSAP